MIPEPEEDKDPQEDILSVPLVTSGGEKVDDEDHSGAGVVMIIILAVAAICFVLIVIVGVRLCRNLKNAKNPKDVNNLHSTGTNKMSQNDSQVLQLKNEQVSVIKK